MAVQFVLPDSKSVSQPPSTLAYIVDRAFFIAAAVGALAIIALVIYFLLEIGGQALPAIGRSGASFLVSTRWDVENASFGILPQIPTLRRASSYQSGKVCCSGQAEQITR